ncbi:MAG: NADH-quinone oxidoreductase subunit L [Methanomicrobiales archaeon HGW-Methanomicrobiales-3]|nr:MAG: NADH-quinone oxidoreductase subunit L [Methanomicrobiales archaeon HGW-Methanomicrobiales-3]
MQIAQLLIFLILFPLIAAFFLLIAKKDTEREWIVKLSALAIGIVSVYLLITTYDKGTLLISAIPAEPTGLVMFILEMIIAVYILYLGITYRRWLVVGLILVQSVMMLYFELVYSHSVHIQANLFSDELSVIMALIIGIIGSLICVYSLGYMKFFHEHHPEMPDKRPWFFGILFLFLSAMFGLVFSNNIIWVYFFWEVTTLCSFLLIGYTKTDEATNNAFLALWMNLLGGIAFAGAIIWLAMFGNGMMGLDALTTSGKVIALVPAALIGFAGLTKAAQLPFSAWLVGAMVAPTPVSALLHSSTMVKAGVYILVRFAPVFDATVTGYLIAMVGALTFLIASGIAISQSNAKRVLAYSTIANLGLIVACAGIGTYEAIWAAILLIVFHAIAKSLLFLATGTVEHRIKSREIDDMNGLIVRMPKIAAMMVIGIAGMFLLPFGMLISKWAAIRAFIDAPYGFLFIIILAFGSAMTLFFWAKWMGKIITVTTDSQNIEGEVDKSEWAALLCLAGLSFITTLLFPMLSIHLLEPFLMANYGNVARLSQDNIIIMILMLFLLMLMPLSILLPKHKHRHLAPYMGGRTTTSDMRFSGSLGVQKKTVLSNYYLQDWFGEKRLKSWGIWLCSAIICIMVLSAVLKGVIL